MPQTTVKRPEHWSLPSVLFTPVGLVGIWPVDSDASVLACGVSEELPERTRAEWTDYESSGEAARAAKAHYAHVKSEPLRSLVDGIKEGQIKLWAPYEMPDLPRWHGERVCLIGDAAHGALDPAEKVWLITGQPYHLTDRVLLWLSRTRHIFLAFSSRLKPCRPASALFSPTSSLIARHVSLEYASSLTWRHRPRAVPLAPGSGGRRNGR